MHDMTVIQSDSTGVCSSITPIAGSLIPYHFRMYVPAAEHADSAVPLLCLLQRLRRVLMSIGLPTSGALSKLQQRAVAVAQAVEGGDTLEDAVEKARKLK